MVAVMKEKILQSINFFYEFRLILRMFILEHWKQKFHGLAPFFVQCTKVRLLFDVRTKLLCTSQPAGLFLYQFDHISTNA